MPPRWVVVDVETTGLDPARDALLAIAAVAIHWRDGEPQLVPLDRFECLVRPDRKSTRLNSSHIQKSRMPSSA